MTAAKNPPDEPLKIISLGAGVQSTTMLLMSLYGDLPRVEHCVFADTQDEPAEVYRHLDKLEAECVKYGVTLHRVTVGRLSDMSLTLRRSRDDKGSYVRNVVPAFTINPDGTKGMLLRKCTQEFKIVPLQRKQRELMKARGVKRVESWIGISLDEAHRMRDSRVKYIQNIYPLIDRRMSRHDCNRWLFAHDWTATKSACFYCPYHSDAQWRDLKDNDPESFEKAVQFERKWNTVVLTEKRPSQTKGKIRLHKSCLPLDQVDFSTEEERGQGSLFGNECEGMCGV